MMESKKAACPLRCVLFAVRSQLFRVMEFFPSMHTPSERFETSFALLTVISAAACVACEFLWEKALKWDITILDGSAVVTGILIAFNVPVQMPIWQLIAGDIFAIIVVKMLFGGIGCNFMNPALGGRILMMFSFTSSITGYTYPANGIDALSSATPLAVQSSLGWNNFMTLFLGNHGGVLGETCVLALLIGAAYLLIRRVIKPWIPLCYLGSLLLFSWAFGAENPVLSLLMGGAVLGAFFMATDYVTSPVTNKGKVIFGIGCGLITAAIRVFGNYAEGVTFSIIIMNLLVPYIDDLTLTKPMGGAK